MTQLTMASPTGIAGLSLQRINGHEYDTIVDLVYEHSRINLGPAKKELVMARLSKRLRHLGFNDFTTYIRHLRSADGQKELVELINAISTNHTFFFRERAHFQFLTQRIFPEYLESARGVAASDGLRIWSAACSTGEEAYSIAIMANEYAATHAGFQWRIECSDISTKVLREAQNGVFSEERLRGVPPEWKKRYFQTGFGDYAGHYRIRDLLRPNIRFNRVNLFQPAYPYDKPFKLIALRNVMIYFDRPSQTDLISRLERMLAPGGYLYIGHAESLAGIEHNLELIQPAIYRKR